MKPRGRRLRFLALSLMIALCACGCATPPAPPPQPAASEAAAPAPPPAATPTQQPAGNKPPVPATGQELGAQPPLPAAAVPATEREAAPPRQPVDPSRCYQFRAGRKNQRCEPQSLGYGRCRSAIDTCRLGRENGPLTWFACEKKRGNTSSQPQAGTILILGANRHGMPTGHVFYVEEVMSRNGSISTLLLSHTNYDRRCSLETDIRADYNAAALTLDIKSGAWAGWGRGLPVAGFILD